MAAPLALQNVCGFALTLIGVSFIGALSSCISLHIAIAPAALFPGVHELWSGLLHVLLAGHLGEFELSVAVLATSLYNVTGVSVLLGFAGSMETLAGQVHTLPLRQALHDFLQTWCCIASNELCAHSMCCEVSISVAAALHTRPRMQYIILD